MKALHSKTLLSHCFRTFFPFHELQISLVWTFGPFIMGHLNMLSRQKYVITINQKNSMEEVRKIK